MNIALIIVVGVVVFFIFTMWQMFGKKDNSIDMFHTEDNVDDADEVPETDAQDRPELLKKREFAEHLIRNNIYTKVFDAYQTALGGKPTLDDISEIISAYKEGKTNMDGMVNYIKDNMSLPAEPETPDIDSYGVTEEVAETEDAEEDDTAEEVAEEETARETDSDDMSGDADNASVEESTEEVDEEITETFISNDDIISKKLLKQLPKVSKKKLKTTVKEISDGLITFGEAVNKLIDSEL
ncbi:hypothetical protein TetV_295 [Tetraselmis virus 1]|uniref:Uncharacterized protein n=1 Tax=Tetraselmis virus 1 TaxID=2060617 RepID=A0A2P0VNA5_9VIRU|nr:hypothetical protein QJ968_gp295 [Tetraselmis virus 1]AUF82387.1 hypothetical protein TetV_295 [Tetraselmis virus 1]